MPDDTVIISNLPSHSPSGSDYLAVEDSSLTGKATVDDVVGASGSVATLNNQVSTLNSKFTSFLPTSTNIDDWLTSGFWLYGRESPYNHTGTFPISDVYGTLICVGGTSANFAIQMIRSNSTSRTEGTLYIRYRSVGTWGGWITYEDDNKTVNTVFASADTSKYTLSNVRLVRRGSIFVLLGEVKCVAPSTSGSVGIVSSGMPNITGGQVFVPAWGANNASKDALGVQFTSSGVFLTYGTAGGYYELNVPLIC